MARRGSTESDESSLQGISQHSVLRVSLSTRRKALSSHDGHHLVLMLEMGWGMGEGGEERRTLRR